MEIIIWHGARDRGWCQSCSRRPRCRAVAGAAVRANGRGRRVRAGAPAEYFYEQVPDCMRRYEQTETAAMLLRRRWPWEMRWWKTGLFL